MLAHRKPNGQSWEALTRDPTPARGHFSTERVRCILFPVGVGWTLPPRTARECNSDNNGDLCVGVLEK